ncbi:uncharacterized protein BJ171DRAFT_542431 [Polychytrium aggregatum]|uniref:uncharacterized protein n=1 Tax=Polychytrium aggregatum TaxID=110093 RepID=UPI0022FDEB85|nr:uncharacterized protein BJ171DRAFT_542431 [Polychytrium aggregatum]KAI9190687.1 hypothetical protein BJ171DRAFT_542431 [Polychytrium aggregatum]
MTIFVADTHCTGTSWIDLGAFQATHGGDALVPSEYFALCIVRSQTTLAMSAVVRFMGHTIRYRHCQLITGPEFQVCVQDCFKALYPCDSVFLRNISKKYDTMLGGSKARYHHAKGELVFAPIHLLESLLKRFAPRNSGKSVHIDALMNSLTPSHSVDDTESTAVSCEEVIDTQKPAVSLHDERSHQRLVPWSNTTTSECRSDPFTPLSPDEASKPFKNVNPSGGRDQSLFGGSCVYVVLVGTLGDWIVIKFGCTDNLERRMQEHTQSMGPVRIIGAIPTPHYRHVERYFSQHFRGGMRISASFKGASGRSKMQTELFRMPPELFDPKAIAEFLLHSAVSVEQELGMTSEQLRIEEFKYKQRIAEAEIEKEKTKHKLIDLYARGDISAPISRLIADR